MMIIMKKLKNKKDDINIVSEIIDYLGAALYRRACPSFKTVHRTVLKFTLCGAP